MTVTTERVIGLISQGNSSLGYSAYGDRNE
jgi:hypothetical protein